LSIFVTIGFAFYFGHEFEGAWLLGPWSDSSRSRSRSEEGRDGAVIGVT